MHPTILVQLNRLIRGVPYLGNQQGIQREFCLANCNSDATICCNKNNNNNNANLSPGYPKRQVAFSCTEKCNHVRGTNRGVPDGRLRRECLGMGSRGGALHSVVWGTQMQCALALAYYFSAAISSCSCCCCCCCKFVVELI